MRLSGLGTYVETQHDDHEDVVGRGEIDLVHDQDLVVTETRLSVDIGLPGGFGIGLTLPLRVVSTSIRYLDTAGMEVDLVAPGVHHRNETVSGLGDPMVLGSYGRRLGPLNVVARVGLTLPLGHTEENPFTLGDAGLRHQHIQLGSGTVNPVLAVEVSRSWGAWRAGAFALTQQALYANGKGYQAGDRYAGGVAVRRRLGRAWSLRGGVEVQGETAERWDGMVHTEEGNQGRVDAMLGAGASWAATRALSIDLGVKVPVVTHVVGGQLDMPAVVELGASWSFGGKRAAAPHVHDHGDEHEHGEHAEHEHDEPAEHGHDEPAEHGHDEPATVHPDTTGLDVVDLGPPGAAVDLVPVAGKITIFDFWATWCEPCKTLEPALVELARAHPDRVAIRRIDVVDWESAAVARHLTPGGFSLPHLKIYDATGRLVLERSSEVGKLQELIDATRAAVEQEQPAPQPTPPAPTPKPVPAPTPKPAPKPAPVSRRITVTAAGFEPANVDVPRGKRVTFVFERKTDKTCATEVVLQHEGKRVEQALPLNQPVTLTLTFSAAGTVPYACAMNHVRGTITVK